MAAITKQEIKDIIVECIKEELYDSNNDARIREAAPELLRLLIRIVNELQENHYDSDLDPENGPILRDMQLSAVKEISIEAKKLIATLQQNSI